MKLKRRRRRKKNKARLKFKEWYAKTGTLNIILILVGLFFVWFNYRMLEMFLLCGSIPETYACAVVAATIGECGICGWIRTTKDKRREHKQDEDEQNDEGGKG